MKQAKSWAGGQMLLSLWTSRLASAAALAALAVFAAPVAKADVIETFALSGSFNGVFGSPVAFAGTMDLDFSNDFTVEKGESISITVHGRPVFNQGAFVHLAISANQGIIGASNSSGDMLSLMFATPNSGTWAGFNTGTIAGGQVIFSDLTGLLIGATGVVTRDPSDPPILAPPINDPPPITSATVPELSTWAMMLLGLAGLGLAAKRRRASGFLGGKA
jgi:hypothetical protein